MIDAVDVLYSKEYLHLFAIIEGKEVSDFINVGRVSGVGEYNGMDTIVDSPEDISTITLSNIGNIGFVIAEANHYIRVDCASNTDGSGYKSVGRFFVFTDG